ncbi:MAG TPA: molybdopterin-dependent oxidoreductase [Casimicrobiaceae bacterium]|nr:molybdopterin-dependent oxidoreductase [Casimicrobiaceae bacterium]
MTGVSSKIIRTMCPMNCHPTLCGMLAEVRDGNLVGVTGDEANPDSRGFLCIRGQASREIIGNPARLLHPLIRDRRTDDFRRAPWDEALDRIVSGMAQPEAVGIWPGHGTFTTNYGTRISAQLLARFANFHGCQFWNPSMICWGLGAFGLGLTGMLETNTKEDMGEHSQLIILWAANLTSQPNTARHLLAAKRRGAHIVTIDVRNTEAGAKSDDVLVIRPGTDTALALAMMHVICAEQRHDPAFVARHTVGFDQLVAHLQAYPPAWAEEITGIPAEQIVALARRYADTRPAMIVLGGSSMHKGANGWQAGRAIACLPALTGNVGIAGGGFGPRHGSAAHGRGLGSIIEPGRRAPGTIVPNQMSAVTAALREGRIQTLLLMGTNMLSSFADVAEVELGLQRTNLVVSYDLFLNDTARRFADVVLPGTAWLEEVGCKMTHTHLYLMERALEPPGETRSLYSLVKELAGRLNLEGFHPWASEEAMVDAILDHRCTGHASVAALRAQGGIRALNVSHVANPTLDFDTPSRKIEFYSEQAGRLGLPPLPSHDMPARQEPRTGPAGRTYSLALTQGRTLTHFHGFYNNGRELPTLARRESAPTLWISPADAAMRQVVDGAAIRIFNDRGDLLARARVTDRIPAGTLWMRDGWPNLNRLTAGAPVLPDVAVDLFAFSAGQATFDAMVEVALA